MIAHDLALALDSVAFAAEAGYPQLDAWQQQVLRSQSRRLILNCSRQSGKSTVTALLALHTAVYQPGALVLVLSRGERQSQELLRTVKHAYSLVHAACPAATRENETALEFAHGSRILALPGTEASTRCYAKVALLIVDEAAAVPDDLFFALRPMVAINQGRIVLLSTPRAEQGFFYTTWKHGVNWEHIKITVDACPRILPDERADMRATLGPWLYARECLAEFGMADDAVFSHDLIQRAFTPSVQPLVLRRPVYD